MNLYLILFSFIMQNSDTILVGKKNINSIKNTSNLEWLNIGIKNYKSDKPILEKLKKVNWSEYSAVAVCGSWCEDTQHLLPQFINVSEQIGLQNVDYYFVDRDKKSPENAKENFSIDRIPTFIIYKNGKELGRIIETVPEPIEQVLLQFVE